MTAAAATEATATATIAALLQQLREGRAPEAAAQEILRLSASLEQQLRQREAEAAAAARELAAFASSVSHDLRAPLSVIDGFSLLLEGAVAKGDSERSAHYLQRLRLGVASMNELIVALLGVSRLLRAPMVVQPVDLSALAQVALATRQAAEPERVTQLTLPPSLLSQGDPALLKQVVEHLIGNAWKFSSKKDKTVITVGKQSGAEGETVYFVRDQGCGFDMTHAEKLFGIFQRMHTPSEFPGLGVGLATAQRIVTRHGGRIWLEALPEQGTTVYFTLPGF